MEMNTLLPVPVLADSRCSEHVVSRMKATCVAIAAKCERAQGPPVRFGEKGLSRRATSTSAALINFGDRTVSRRNRGARTQEKAAGPVTVG